MSKKSQREIELERQLAEALKILSERDKTIILQQKEIETLKQQLAKANKELEKKILEIKKKNDIILLNNYNQYFSKSEKTKNILKKARNVKVIENSTKEKRGRKAGTGNHEELNLIEPDKIITLTPEEIKNEIAAGNCVIIGRNSSYKIVKNPASYQLIRIDRPKYLFEDKFYQSLSDDMFGKSIITPSFVANAMYLKFNLSLPINKLSKFIKTEYGINISNQSWCDYFEKTATMLEPIHKLIKKEFIENSAGIIHLDETTVSIAKSKQFPDKKDYYFLCGCTTYYDHPIKIYKYLGPRIISNEDEILANYKGVVICDGFAGYNKLENVKIQRCWVHARRYVSDSIKIRDVKNDLPQVELLEEINKLFEIETKIEDCELSEIAEVRNSESVAVLDKIKSICDKNKKTKIDKFSDAIKYITKYWDELCLFLSDPCIPIHNNQAERTVGYFVQARKNFQTICSDESAIVNASLFTICMTAEANGLDVEKYICYALEELYRGTDAKKLLPWSDDVPQNLFIKGLKK